MPILCEVALGMRKKLDIYGDDYDTPDGTAIRDYIHVTDLANAHISALKKNEKLSEYDTLNIGTGHGISVKQFVDQFAEVIGKPVPSQVVNRRPGDVDKIYSCTDMAFDKIGFNATYDLKKMCADTWNWINRNSLT